jgi:uncharacterized protein
MRHHPLRQLCLLSCTTLAVSCVTPGSKITDASNTVVPSAMPSHGPQASADQLADAMFVSLKKNDFIEAEQHFDNAMKQGLPPDRLEAVWKNLSESVGALKSWSIAERSEAQGVQIRAVDLAFENGQLRGLVSAREGVREIVGFRIVPAPVAKPVQAAVPENEFFRSESLNVGTTPFLLGGTLTIPKRGPRSFPAVVLIAGSGPNDRDETVGANKTLRDLAEGLSSKGVMTLRYDKRTFAHADKMSRSDTVEQEVIADAVSAIELLRQRPEVDANKIFVVGHSLGALLAPEIAQRAGGMAGMVLLAAPSRQLPQIIVEQMRFLKALPAEKLDELEKKAKLLVQGKLSDTDSFLGQPVHYFVDLGKRDEMAIAQKLKLPLLYIRGDRDFQVTDVEQSGWEKALKGSSFATFKTLGGLNHLLMAGQGAPNSQEYEVAGHVEAGVIDLIATFVTTNASVKSGAAAAPSNAR